MPRRRPDPERQARMDRYCEALLDELIELGVPTERLLTLRAGALSELLITERQAQQTRRRWPDEMPHHPSARRR